MRSSACPNTNHDSNHDLLPKLHTLNRDKQMDHIDTRSLSLMKSSIKGVVGQAISFFSNSYLNHKSSHKKQLQTNLKSIFDKNVIVVKDRFGQQNPQSEKQTNINSLSEYVTSMRYSIRKSKYHAFERMVKMNSDNFEPYQNWLLERRKVSPATFMKKCSISKPDSCKIVDSTQTMISESSEEKMEGQQMKEQTLNRFVQKQKKKQKQKLQQKNQNQSDIEELFLARTNLVKKISCKYESSPKKLIYVKYPERNNKIYKYYLGPGNNHEIIKKVLQETRGSNWISTTQQDTLFNLKWQQYSDKSIYNLLDFSRYKQVINHFQFHEAITTKAGLIDTLRQYWGRGANHIDIFKFVPLTFVFDSLDKSKFEEELKKFVYFYCLNHPDATRIGRVERDYADLSRQLWKIPNMSFDKNLLKRSNNLTLDPVFRDANSRYLWIYKPSELNRGRGIQIFSTLQQLSTIIKESRLPTQSFVIQKYIEKPLLIKNRKFDIRVWVLLTREGQAYFFQEGYIRTSSEQFTLDLYGNDNQYVHLTNNAVQKNNKNYGIFEEGNQLSFDDVDQALNKRDGYFKRIWVAEMKKICGVVVEAGFGKITSEWSRKHHPHSSFIKETYRVRVKNSTNINETPTLQKISLPRIPSPQMKGQSKSSLKKGSFQIFGFDFMIDAEEKLWLIEVNTNPCLETSSRILENLIPRMIDDAFKIVLDPVFKLSTRLEKSPYSVKGYPDCKNMWNCLGGPKII